MYKCDIYDNELLPGDLIVFLQNGQLANGKIHTISIKGTVNVFKWLPAKKNYAVFARPIRTWQVIKILGIPKI